MKRFSFSLGIGSRVRQGTNPTILNGITEEDSSFFISEEDSTNILISED